MPTQGVQRKEYVSQLIILHNVEIWKLEEVALLLQMET